MDYDKWGPWGPPSQSLDSLMKIPALDLAVKLASCVSRLRQFKDLAREHGLEDQNFMRWAINHERARIRSAETVARARVRELAALVFYFAKNPTRG